MSSVSYVPTDVVSPVTVSPVTVSPVTPSENHLITTLTTASGSRSSAAFLISQGTATSRASVLGPFSKASSVPFRGSGLVSTPTVTALASRSKLSAAGWTYATGVLLAKGTGSGFSPTGTAMYSGSAGHSLLPLAASADRFNGSWSFSKKGMTLAPTSIQPTTSTLVQDCTITQTYVQTRTITVLEPSTASAASLEPENQMTEGAQPSTVPSPSSVPLKSSSSLPFSGAAQRLGVSHTWLPLTMLIYKAILSF